MTIKVLSAWYYGGQSMTKRDGMGYFKQLLNEEFPRREEQSTEEVMDSHLDRSVMLSCSAQEHCLCCGG